MTSRALFFQRKLYDKVTFPYDKKVGNLPLDFWYEKTYYGRSDFNARSIHLSERYLKQFPLGGLDAHYAVNFVVDAFMDLRQEMLSLANRGVTVSTGPYANMQLTKAWVSPNKLYHYVMESVTYQRFKEYLLAFRLDKKIYNFDSFVKVFLQFIDIETPKIPFTRSKMIMTNLSTPMVSGLAIEIDSLGHDDDLPKVRDFLLDPNFAIFRQTAKRYGFNVDMHAPWRLVADLGSPALGVYMRKYGVDRDTVIDRYYYRSHLYDLPALRTYIIEFYNSYVTAKPTVVQPKFKYEKGRLSVDTHKIMRKVHEKDQIGEKYDDQFWLRMYAFIRAREENLDWSQEWFEKFVRNAYHYYLAKGEETAIEYIDRKCKVPSNSSKKERDFSFINTISVI